MGLENLKNLSPRLFNDKILKTLPDGWLKNEGIKNLVMGFIGNSKLAFLDTNGNTHLINEGKGHWNDDCGIWFSNDSYADYSCRFGYPYQYQAPKINLGNNKPLQARYRPCELCGAHSQLITAYLNGIKTEICSGCSRLDIR